MGGISYWWRKVNITFTSKKIRFRNGYKSQLVDTIAFQLPRELWPDNLIDTEFLRVDCSGAATVRAGYAWDRASGPTVDHPYEHTVASSLAHDVLCQLERNDLFNSFFVLFKCQVRPIYFICIFNLR